MSLPTPWASASPPATLLRLRKVASLSDTPLLQGEDSLSDFRVKQAVFVRLFSDLPTGDTHGEILAACAASRQADRASERTQNFSPEKRRMNEGAFNTIFMKLCAKRLMSMGLGKAQPQAKGAAAASSTLSLADAAKRLNSDVSFCCCAFDFLVDAASGRRASRRRPRAAGNSAAGARTTTPASRSGRHGDHAATPASGRGGRLKLQQTPPADATPGGGGDERQHPPEDEDDGWSPAPLFFGDGIGHLDRSERRAGAASSVRGGTLAKTSRGSSSATKTTPKTKTKTTTVKTKMGARTPAARGVGAVRISMSVQSTTHSSGGSRRHASPGWVDVVGGSESEDGEDSGDGRGIDLRGRDGRDGKERE